MRDEMVSEEEGTANWNGFFKGLGSMTSVHVNALGPLPFKLRLELDRQRLRRTSLTHETMAGRNYPTSTTDTLHPTLNRDSRVTRPSGFRAYSKFPRCQRAVNSNRHRL